MDLSTLLTILIIIIVFDKIRNLIRRRKPKPAFTPHLEKDDDEEVTNIESYKSCYKKKYLMSINEKAQFWKLKEITDKLNLLLFTKVRMIDIVEPKTNEYTKLNKIIRKHIDFLVLDKKGYTLCAIEIDDNSHYKEKQKKSDEFKDFVLKDVGIPIIRTNGIKPEEIENRLKELSKVI